MDFGEVLTKAWKIIWKYKILWLFGIFASCSGGNGGGGGGGGGGSSSINYSGNYGTGPYNLNIEPWAIVLIVAAIILLAVIITVIVVAVSTVGRVGLIQGTKMADEDEDAKLTFGSVFNSTKPFFWRVIGLNLLIMVGWIALFILIGMFFLFGTIFTLGLGLICLLPLCCVLIPAFWVLSTFVEMANVAIVVEDLSVIDGLKRGWEVFKGHLGEMVLMGLVLVLGGFIVGMILAMPMILAVIPLMIGIVAAASGDTSGFATASFIAPAICCVAYLPVLIVIGGIIRAYIGAAWTLTYLRLTRGPAVEEPAELLPEISPDPEPLPEATQGSAAEEGPEEVADAAPEKPADSEDPLPEDF